MNSDSFHHKLDRPFGLIQVGVAFLNVADRHAVCAEEYVRLRRVLIREPGEFFARRRSHGFDVILVGLQLQITEVGGNR